MAQGDDFVPKLDRRGFVRLVVAGGSAVATGGLLSCGGGGGGGVDEGGGAGEIPIGTIAEDDRAAVLDANGEMLMTLTLPATVPFGFTLAVQGLVLAVAGEQLSNPMQFTLVP